MQDRGDSIAGLVRDHLREQLLPAFQEIGEERWSERVRSMRLHEAPPRDGADALDKYSPLVRKQYKTALRERRVGARARAPSFKAFYAKLWSNFVRKPHVASGEWFTTATLRDQTDIAMEATQAAFAEMAARMVHIDEDGQVIAGDDSDSFASVRTTETYAARAAERRPARAASRMSSVDERDERDGYDGRDEHDERDEIAPEDSASGGVDAPGASARAADDDRITVDVGDDWRPAERSEVDSRARPREEEPSRAASSAVSRAESSKQSREGSSPPRSRADGMPSSRAGEGRARGERRRGGEAAPSRDCALDLG